MQINDREMFNLIINRLIPKTILASAKINNYILIFGIILDSTQRNLRFYKRITLLFIRNL